MTLLSDDLRDSAIKAGELETALTESDERLAGANRTITDLRRDLTERDAVIASQRERIAGLEALLAGSGVPAPAPAPLPTPDRQVTEYPDAHVAPDGARWRFGAEVDERGRELIVDDSVQVGTAGVAYANIDGVLHHRNRLGLVYRHTSLGDVNTWRGYGWVETDASLWPSSAPAPAPVPQPSVNGQFQVRAHEIVAPDGSVFGVGTTGAGANIFANQSAVLDAMWNVWRMEMARIVWHSEPSAYYGQGGTREDQAAAALACAAKKKVAVLDWHTVGGEPSDHKAKITEHFSYLFSKLGANPYCWPSLYNEPGGGHGMVLSGGRWVFDAAYAQGFVAAVREIVATLRAQGWVQPIVVPTPFVGQDLARTPTWGTINQPLAELSFILSYGRAILEGHRDLIFDMHAYEAWEYTSHSCIDYMEACKQKGLAVLVGEVGIKNKDSCLRALARVFAARKAGHAFPVIGWHALAQSPSWFTTEKDIRILKPNAGDLSSATNLSEMGKAFRTLVLGGL